MVTDLASNKSLDVVAILLITRLKPGPKLIFHYPPNPKNFSSDVRTTISDPSGSGDDSDDGHLRGNLPNGRHGQHLRTKTANGSRMPLTGVAPGTDASTALDSIFGYGKDALAKLLAPGRWCDKKRFEIDLDGLIFTGCPIFADEEGKWSQNGGDMVSKIDSTSEKLSPALDMVGNDPAEMSSGGVNINATIPRFRGKVFESLGSESLDSQGVTSLATSMQSVSTTFAFNVAEQMTMFNVVFVLRAGHDTEVGANLNRFVARKLSKALRYCQKQTGYIASESRRLLALQAKARHDGTNVDTLWSQMCETSELAWALKEIYDKISKGRIAGFRLSGNEMSLQLPLEVVAHSSNDVTLNVHSGVLLMEDKSSLLQDLTQPEASLLASFVRGLTPAKSLEKNARNMAMPIGNVMYMARHLIKWRKARAIVPLHPRNLYITGSNAPFSVLTAHITEYARLFSALPSLPHILSTLSAKPVKYGTLIPSRDHRDAYMDILAYLVRNEFVVQLKTYGWLQTLEEESEDRDTSNINRNRRPLSVAQLLSPQLRPADDDTVSVSSERTAIPISTHDLGRVTSSETATSSRGRSSAQEIEMLQRRIIIDPIHLSEDDEQSVLQVQNSIADDELRERFSILLPYLDGEHALEEIAAMEGLKRSKIESWFDILQKQGHLITFRRT